MRVLVLNAGSSSLKFALYEGDGDTTAVRVRGSISDIGRAPRFGARGADGSEWPAQTLPADTGQDAALDWLLDHLAASGHGFHIKEAPSTMPAPDSHQEVLDQAGADVPPARLVTVEKCDEINTSDEHQTSTVLSRLIPDSSPLIPDTGFPNTPQPPRRGGVRVQYPPEFEEFWAEVERKEPSKAKALDSWQRARRKASAEDILAGLRRWLPVWAVTEPDKVPYITTWLNQERWTVEKPVPPSNGRHPPPRQPSNPGTYFDLGERYERQGL